MEAPSLRIANSMAASNPFRALIACTFSLSCNLQSGASGARLPELVGIESVRNVGNLISLGC